VESQEDMPSIVRMSNSQTKGMRRKPAIAHVVNGTKLVVSVHSDLHDEETTADEGCEGCETESPQESLVFSPQDVPSEQQAEHVEWPDLPVAAVDAPAAAEESRPSHREVALRFAEEALEEQAAADRRCAKTAAAARSAREASMWKPSWSKRRQRLLAAKRARKQMKARSATVQRCEDLTQGLAPAAVSFDFEADLDVVKMARAAARHRSLHIKRAERARARDARDWTWGKGIEDAKPHHCVRAAARVCFAKGMIESQEDMPSIVCMSKPGDKGTRRKPSIAHSLQGAKVLYDAFEEAACDSSPAVEEVESATVGSPCDRERLKLEKEAAASVPTAETEAEAEAEPASRRAGCVIS